MNNSADCPPSGIQVLPEAATLPIQPRKSLLELCLAHRIPLTHACGGMARCSTCRVVVLQGSEHCTDRNAAEQDLAHRLGFDTHVRLACQTRVTGPAEFRRLVLDERDEDFAGNPGPLGKTPALGEEVVAALLFCDIRGFTKFSRRVMPYDAIHLLNRFYSTLGPQIAAHGGEINNTMGDGFLAIFPQADERDACRAAVRAGLTLLGVMPALADYSSRAYGEELRIGIGIHSGPVIRGNVGHGNSKRVAIIGDNVNLASRIESATKEVGRPLLVSSRVRELADDAWAWSNPKSVLLSGFPEPTPLYSPILRENF